jgi:hypothetical protein
MDGAADKGHSGLKAHRCPVARVCVSGWEMFFRIDKTSAINLLGFAVNQSSADPMPRLVR